MFIFKLPIAFPNTIHAFANTEYECALMIGAISGKGKIDAGVRFIPHQFTSENIPSASP
jgi:hypothetical protein